MAIHSLTPTHRRTYKGELAAELLPNTNFDCALPQDFVNHCQELGMDVRQHCVWAYPNGYLFGMPAPVTVAAAEFLNVHGLEYFTEPTGRVLREVS